MLLVLITRRVVFLQITMPRTNFPIAIWKRDSANLNGDLRPVNGNSIEHTSLVLISSTFGGGSVQGESRVDDAEVSPEFNLSLPCDPNFRFEDANVDLQAGRLHFWVHQHMLEDFQGLKARLDRTPEDEEQERKLVALRDRAKDVRNMLLVLYSRPYTPHNFDTATFESAFKLASKYGHPGLRTYTIQQLDRHPLSPIERFRLSRDYNVPQWMLRAITELSWRDKPITAAEAGILGAEKTAEVAEKREALRFGLGRWSCNACKGESNLQGEATGDKTPIRPEQGRASRPKHTADVVPNDTAPMAVKNPNARLSFLSTPATKPSFVFGFGNSSQFQPFKRDRSCQTLTVSPMPRL